MIELYDDRKAMAAKRKRAEHGRFEMWCDGLLYEGIYVAGIIVGQTYSRDASRDILVTQRWFYHRQLALRPRDIVEEADDLLFD